MTRFPDQLRRHMSLALKKHSRDIQRRSRSKLPTGRGNAARSITYDVDEQRLDAFLGIDTAFTPVADYIHDGTRQFGPHKTQGPPIRAKNKKVLCWVDKKTGKKRFAKMIKNPKGMRPNPFMVDAAKELDPQFHTRVDKATANAAKGTFV